MEISTRNHFNENRRINRNRYNVTCIYICERICGGRVTTYCIYKKNPTVKHIRITYATCSHTHTHTANVQW